MKQPNDIEQQGWDLVIHDHHRDPSVNKMKCKNLPDRDRDEFRCRRAVNWSSYILNMFCLH